MGLMWAGNYNRRLRAFGARKPLAVALAAFAPLAVRALLLPWMPAPVPRVHDEFSHLLAADTFAHGRLVNPVHPLWPAFESMHMVVRPVYGSIFPAAPGAFMAAGQRLFGTPWAGVWIAVGLMSGALCWMLQGWMPPGWALLGALLAGARWGVSSYWMNSYYGGAVAAAAGALVLGALPRVRRRRRWTDAVLLAIGLALLANSRPYEGLAFALPVAAVFAWQTPLRARWKSLVLPAVPVLAVAAVGLGYYCHLFSGSPFRLPYSFYRETVAVAPHFVFQPPRTAVPEYHHRVLRDFHLHWEMLSYSDARAGIAPYSVASKGLLYWRFFLGPFLTIPLLALPWLWKRRRLRPLLAALPVFALALAVEVWQAPHYAAPAAGLVILLAMEGFRHLRADAGPWPVRLLVAGCLLTPVVGGNGTPVGDGRSRAAILQQLESSGGRHVVLVRYSLQHNPGDEWVYNAAEIDSAPVVWAREMDPASNRKLLAYFRGRSAWIVQPDVDPVPLRGYDADDPPDPPFQFVKLGTDAVTVLHDPAEVARKVRQAAPAGPLTCDLWDFYFTRSTGVESPDPADGCFPAGERARAVSFDEWWEWLRKQR
jgi:hypothetical protein